MWCAITCYPEEGDYSCLYLPDDKFVLSDESGSFAWLKVGDNEVKQ